ncbi:MAG TPA: DUF6134 family protein [Chitinophagaceae bacterium]
MVPALLYLFLRKYVARKWPHFGCKMKQTFCQRNFVLFLAFLSLFLLKISSLKAQEELKYMVVKNGKVIGWTKLTRTNVDQRVHIKLESEVKATFLFQFVVKAVEEAIFSNGNLVYSSQFRKMNADVKENKSMKLTSRGYEVYKGNITQLLSFAGLRNNMLSLYFAEPLLEPKVYSDSFQQLLDVKKIAERAYKVRLPDGNSCSYYYKNGLCTNIKIDNRFYSAELMLNQ